MNSLFHYYLVMWKLYCLAGHLDTEVVKADSNVGRVDESSVGRGDTVGGGLGDGSIVDNLGGDLGDGSIVDNLGDDPPGVVVGGGQGGDNIGGGVEESGVSLGLSLGLSISRPLSIVRVGVGGSIVDNL